MGLRTIFKTAGHWLKGAIVKVDSEIQFDVTTNPEIDSTGGEFMWNTKTSDANSWKLHDPGTSEDILTTDTSAKTLTLHTNYTTNGFGSGDTYYVQKDTNTTGGTADAPFDSMVELVPSSGDFELTVAETGSYMVYITVGIGTDLNKDSNALQIMWGLNGSLGGAGNDDARRNGQHKKNKRNGIQGTWINVSLTAGDVVTAFLSTCDDSCTWENGRMWVALWK